jgi:hypothetical protein
LIAQCAIAKTTTIGLGLIANRQDVITIIAELKPIKDAANLLKRLFACFKQQLLRYLRNNT